VAMKGTTSGSRGLDLNSLAGKLLGRIGLGGYTTIPPGRDQPGTWLPMGEPAAGGNNQQNGVMWGVVTTYQDDIATSTAQCSIMVESPRQVLQQNAAPLYQRLTLAYLDGQVDIAGLVPANGGLFTNSPNSAVSVLCGIGMYMAKFNPDTSLYAVQDPLSAPDVSRFNWIFLEQRTVTFYLENSLAQWAPAENYGAQKLFDLTRPDFNQVLGPGEALMLSLNSRSISGPIPTTAIIGPTVVQWQPAVRGLLVRGS